MEFHEYGNPTNQRVMLIPGLGVSHEIFEPLIKLLEDDYHVIAVAIDGFIIGQRSLFTSVEDQAEQVIDYIKHRHNSHIEVIYGLSLGGKILSRIMERGAVSVDHAIMDAAPLKALPGWLVHPLRYLQCANVWSCYHHTRFWRWVFHSHYFDTLLDECRKVYPYGGCRAVLDGYESVYTSSLQRLTNAEGKIYYWHGTKEAFIARIQVRHLKSIRSDTMVDVFPRLNHGELLIEHPEEVAARIKAMTQ